MEKAILFGASKLGKMAYEVLKDKYDICFFCDNDEQKWGSGFCGLSIISPRELEKIYEKGQYLIIISSEFNNEIFHQLHGLNIKKVYSVDLKKGSIKGIFEPFYLSISNKTMMVSDEIHYLFSLAKDTYTGEGEIVDAGCLLGGSTVAFGEGLKRNETVELESKYSRIHAYDLFKYYDYMKDLTIKETKKEGESLLPEFSSNVIDYYEFLSIYPGDILKRSWNNEKIEILFIDLSKSRELNQHLVKSFFGNLIPGKSIVIQQDYYFDYCYWIHLTMEFFAEYFETMEYPGGATLPFKLVKEIPKELLEIDIIKELTSNELLLLMDNVIDKNSQADGILELKKARERLKSHLGEKIEV